MILSLFPQEEPGEDQPEHADRDVDQKDPAPVLVLYKVATNDRSAGGRYDERDHKYRGALGALLRREGPKEHGGTDRRKNAAAHALQDTEGDERFDVPGEAAEERAGGEDEQRQ